MVPLKVNIDDHVKVSELIMKTVSPFLCKGTSWLNSKWNSFYRPQEKYFEKKLKNMYLILNLLRSIKNSNQTYLTTILRLALLKD